jgi:hypothetical protein
VEVGDQADAGDIPTGATISISVPHREFDDEEEWIEAEVVCQNSEQVIVAPIKETNEAGAGELFSIDAGETVILRKKTELDPEALLKKAKEAIALHEAAAEVDEASQSEPAQPTDVLVSDKVEPSSNADDLPDAKKPRKSAAEPRKSVNFESMTSEKSMTSEQSEQWMTSQSTEQSAPKEEPKEVLPTANRTTRSMRSLVQREVLRRYDKDALTLHDDLTGKSFTSSGSAESEVVAFVRLSTRDLHESWMQDKKTPLYRGVTWLSGKR